MKLGALILSTVFLTATVSFAKSQDKKIEFIGYFQQTGPEIILSNFMEGEIINAEYTGSFATVMLTANALSNGQFKPYAFSVKSAKDESIAHGACDFSMVKSVKLDSVNVNQFDLNGKFKDLNEIGLKKVNKSAQDLANGILEIDKEKKTTHLFLRDCKLTDATGLLTSDLRFNIVLETENFKNDSMTCYSLVMGPMENDKYNLISGCEDKK
ncbi:MAG: hypothetical protein ACOYOK_06490 [Pseudobdellovibrionaceae bacterium]